MSIPEQTPQTSCPFVGLIHDPRSMTSYPSSGNLCYRCAPHVVPVLSYQDEYCLTGKHVECPVFQGAEKTLAKGLAIKPSAVRDETEDARKPGMFHLVAMLTGVFIMVALAVAINLIVPSEPQSNWLPPAAVTRVSPPTETLNPTAQSTPAEAEVAAAQPSSTPTEIPFTPTPSITPTPEPVQVFIGFDTPLGALQKVLIHQIQDGDQLVLLAKYNKTTSEAIMAATYDIKIPLWTGRIIVIPIDTETWDAHPALEPFQVGEDITLDDLAAVLGVDAQALKYYNGCDTCIIMKDSWVVIPRGP